MHITIEATIIANLSWLWALSRGGLVRVAPIQFAQPVCALVFASALLDERLNGALVLVAAVIILGTVTACRGAAHSSRKTPHTKNLAVASPPAESIAMRLVAPIRRASSAKACLNLRSAASDADHLRFPQSRALGQKPATKTPLIGSASILRAKSPPNPRATPRRKPIYFLRFSRRARPTRPRRAPTSAKRWPSSTHWHSGASLPTDRRIGRIWRARRWQNCSEKSAPNSTLEGFANCATRHDRLERRRSQAWEQQRYALALIATG